MSESDLDTGLDNAAGLDSKEFVDAATELTARLNALNDAVLVEVDTTDIKGGQVAHAFYRRLNEVGKAGHAALKPRIQKLTEELGGAVDNDHGTVTASEVTAATTLVYTDETVVFLETAGVLPQCVRLNATMKDNVDVENMPSDDLAVIKKYFEVALIPDPAKIAALVTLGTVSSTSLDETCDEEVTRAGYGAVRVTPSKELKALFKGGA